MKDNLGYYPHNSDSHFNAKFYVLRAKYGWAGEGMFWALNNTIARATNCRLDMGSMIQRAPLTGLFNMSFDELDEFINYLCNDCELLLREGDTISTRTVSETYTKIEGDREKARLRKMGVSKSSGEPSKSSGEPLKRVEKRRVEKSREEKKYVDLPVDALPPKPTSSVKSKPNSDEVRPAAAKKTTKQTVAEKAKATLDYWNSEVRPDKKPLTSKAYTDKIAARIKAGATAVDLAHAIKDRCLEWLHDPKMQKHLKPETIFAAGNFERYLDSWADRTEADRARITNLRAYCTAPAPKVATTNTRVSTAPAQTRPLLNRRAKS